MNDLVKPGQICRELPRRKPLMERLSRVLAEFVHLLAHQNAFAQFPNHVLRTGCRSWFGPGRSPRRGDPSIPRPAVTDAFHYFQKNPGGGGKYLVLTHLLRACLKNTRGSVFAQKALWRGSPPSGPFLSFSDSTREHPPSGAVTEAQRSQRAFCAKTLRAVVLLAAASVDSALKARYGDSRASSPRLRPKSLAAEPLVFLRHALRTDEGQEFAMICRHNGLDGYMRLFPCFPILVLDCKNKRHMRWPFGWLALLLARHSPLRGCSSLEPEQIRNARLCGRPRQAPKWPAAYSAYFCNQAPGYSRNFEIFEYSKIFEEFRGLGKKIGRFAVESALKRNGGVGPLELFQEMGLLQAVQVENWRKGKEHSSSRNPELELCGNFCVETEERCVENGRMNISEVEAPPIPMLFCSAGRYFCASESARHRTAHQSDDIP